MKIGIDGHSICNQRSGDESYTLGLIKGLSLIDRDNNYTVYVTNDKALDVLNYLPDNFRVKIVRPHNRWIRLLFCYPYVLLKDNNDIVHFQYIAPLLFRKTGLVLTIHDISYRVFPHYFGFVERVCLRKATPLMIKRAHKIITVSQFSKRQIIKYYRVNQEKIIVTYNAVGDNFKKIDNNISMQRIVLNKYGLAKGRYILYVGTLSRRKNLHLLIQAYKKLPHYLREGYKLVICGKKSRVYSELVSLVKDLRLEDKVKFTGYVSSEQLPFLYTGSAIFVYPSTYEGFGIPAIEAMQTGTPVVCYAGSSLAEVSGDAAVTLKEITVDSLVQGITLLLTNPTIRAKLIEKGYKRAQLFRWENTAQITLSVYKEVFTKIRKQKE